MSGSAAQSTTSLLWSMVFRECPLSPWHKWSKGHDSERIPRPDFCRAPMYFALGVAQFLCATATAKIVFHTPGPLLCFLLLSSSKRLSSSLCWLNFSVWGWFWPWWEWKELKVTAGLSHSLCFDLEPLVSRHRILPLYDTASSFDVLWRLPLQTRASNVIVILYVPLSFILHTWSINKSCCPYLSNRFQICYFFSSPGWPSHLLLGLLE